MPRDVRAYLSDIVDVCRARRIVDFRNRLTHEYPTVDDALVWAIVSRDVALLRKESASLLARPDTEPSEQ